MRFGIVAALAVLVFSFQNCSEKDLDVPSGENSAASVRVDGDITVLSRPGDSVFYVGTPIRVAALARSESNLPLTYKWFKSGAILLDQTSSVLDIPSAAPTDEGEYRLEISNKVDDAAVTLLIKVSLSPVVQITAQPQPQSRLEGQPVNLSVTASISDPGVSINYQWYRNNQAIAGATAASYAVASPLMAASGLYHVEVSNSAGIKQIVKSNAVAVAIGTQKTAAGCSTQVVPAGVTKMKVIAIGGGGAGQPSSASIAYNTLSGGGGAAVEAVVTVPAGGTVAYCVGAAGGTGGPSTFAGNLIIANGGEYGQGWHYKGEDGRGTPPTLGGTYSVGAGVQIIRAANGGNVSSLGACGGNAGFSLDGVNTGLGSCSTAAPGTNYGGGGYSNGRYYTTSAASAGAGGYVRMEPVP